MVFLVPVGLYYCFVELNDANLFAVIYVLFASYFASIMVRLVLVLTPGACVLAGIGASVTMQNFSDVVASPPESVLIQRAKIAAATKSLLSGMGGAASASVEKLSVRVPRVSKLVGWLVILCFLALFGLFTIHCNWVTSTAYSSPSIVLQAQGPGGSLIVFDDFREAYSWLRHNTAPDAKILSWWDYGYQITGMGNRTVIVDNNTRNNTHIATVGLIMASNEERAYPVIRSLDVDYLLVIFGGKIGYSSDDINKFLWMVRISGGIFPEVVESEYFNSHGQYRIDSTISKRMSESLMYKMCYYGFDKISTHYGRPSGFDLVRGSEMGVKNIQFDYLEEAFTSEHWMVRIYKVLKEEEKPGLIERIEKKKLGF